MQLSYLNQRISLMMQLLFLFIFNFTSCQITSKVELVKYLKVYHNGKEYKTSDQYKMNYSEKLNILATLNYYGVDSKIEYGELWIDKKCYDSDLELIYNIQIKAKDSLWLKEHLEEK